MDGGSSRLSARPAADAPAALPAGMSRLAGGALAHVPPAAAEGTASPLVVLFHGAGSSAGAALGLLGGIADEHGLVLLAPQSVASTWDVIHGGFGPDVERLDRTLGELFAACPVDPDRVALGGFSDGASYALSLGLGNGDLARHLIAFSPGFVAPAGQVGRPRAVVTHGTADPVLPIDRCSRRIVPMLRRAGYDVTYEEFEGGHVVGREQARLAAGWLRAG